VKTDDIRSEFLNFFKERGHTVERSDLLVPANDPTLMFTSAGMVQFKSYYTGEVPVPYRRAVTSQKCLRAGGKANDLDEVGKTTRHMTFFEMLGNFSFGDYFKREAIQWGWEFTTDVMGIPGDKVWVSVFENDDEAYDIWAKEIGFPESRLIRMGAKDNFWGPAGETGACGPCSELHYDKGEEIDPNADPDNDPNERFMEFWNLVFPQFDHQLDGSQPELKNKGIDTGMGLERLAALLQGVPTVFDTDGIIPIIRATETLTNVKYEDNPVPYRVIADHIRALSFLITDGVLPSNEGRGYVERRLLRRAARFGRELGLEKPFLYEVSRTVVDLMSRQYPELVEKQIQIEKIIQTEEERFAGTLARGMDVLDGVFERLQKEGTKEVPGEDLFKLHDTFGFPLDLATDIAEDRGYEADHDGFNSAMSAQREKARNAWTGSGAEALSPVYQQIRDTDGETEFLGYDTTDADAVIIGIVQGGRSVDVLKLGDEGEIILDRTPFYSESGGQVGDTGVLDAVNGVAHVNNTKSPLKKVPVHYAVCTAGELRTGDTVSAQANQHRRDMIMNHHTATHLLQAALQHVLGDHVHQAGSLVAPDRLRFDFTHFQGIDDDRLNDIERLVNQYIRTATPVTIESKDLEDARAAGAMALFGEKYDDVVRVVSIGDISMELCGGTHVSETGVIGYFKIISESSISSGVRRVEAVCGEPAVDTLQERDTALQNAARLVGAPLEKLEGRIQALLDENKSLTREVSKWKQAAATGGGTDYMSQVQDVAGIKLLAVELDGQDAGGLRMAMDKLRDQIGSGVVVLGSGSEGKASLCVAVTKDLTAKIKAGDIVKQLAPIVGGGGGGKPDMAMAGGKDPDKIGDAIGQAGSVVEGLLA
jgi:alanyl-tRNA synthetase